jgi:hypothetical protein
MNLSCLIRPLPRACECRWLLLITAFLLITGCSSFNPDWNAAATQQTARTDLAGRWQGTWASDENGHTEQLRCLMTRISETNYSARFQAKYRKLIRLTFTYAVPLTVERQDDHFNFHGDADLGWMAGGLYHYRGHADRTNFFSSYECKYDHGTFHMTRVEAQPGASLK